MLDRRAVVLVVAVVVGWTGLQSACGKEEDRAGSPTVEPELVLQGVAKGDVLATAGEVTVTAGDVAALLRTRSEHQRKRFNGSLEEKKRVVQELLQRRLMVAEAMQRGLHRDPGFRMRVEQLLVTQLMQRLRKTLVTEAQISEVEVDAELNKYDRGLVSDKPRVRVSVVVVGSVGEARRVLAEARRSGDYRHFISLVQRHSVDEVSRGQKGDLGFFAADDARVEAGVREAAMKIKPLWGIAGPVRYGERWAVVMKTGFRPVIKGLLEGRRKAARRRVLQRRRAAAVKGFVEGVGRVERDLDEKTLKVTNVESKL